LRGFLITFGWIQGFLTIFEVKFRNVFQKKCFRAFNTNIKKNLLLDIDANQMVTNQRIISKLLK